MAKGLEWLNQQNELRASAAKSKREDRGGQGRALARRAWVARRSEARRLARRRQEVVGRVRLLGKGPPPRLGPLNAPRHWVEPPGCTDAEEPFDDTMRALVEKVWAREDDSCFMAQVVAASERARRQPPRFPSLGISRLNSRSGW